MITLILILMLGLKLEMGLAFYILVVIQAMTTIINSLMDVGYILRQRKMRKEIDKEFNEAIAKLEKNLEKYEQEKEKEKENNFVNFLEKNAQELKKEDVETWEAKQEEKTDEQNQ